MTNYDGERALELLRLGSGHADAEFREDQESAIQHVVEGRGRLLVVQKTGWGKSFVYFIAMKLLRQEGLGPALLISPLLALMRNQLKAAESMGVRARTINSGNEDEWDEIKNEIDRDKVDVLLIAPERLSNEWFLKHVMAKIAAKISLLVVDEAHCISDWGHDFRPHYRRLERIIVTLPPNLRVLATTATANDRVRKDLEKVLGPHLKVSRGDLNRASLSLQAISLATPAERLAWLAEHVPARKKSGIIYTLTKRDAHLVADWLVSQGVDAKAYTSDVENRDELEQALLDNELKVLVATVSLGMGFDKPDLAFVIHYQSPASVVHYYQQVGRAGRAMKRARGILLSGDEEEQVHDYFIASAFPTREEVEEILAALEKASEGLSAVGLLGVVNIGRGRIDHALQLLSLESPAPIVQQGTKWQLTAAELSEDFWERAARLTKLRRREQKQMKEYVALPSGHMEFLIEALDGDPSTVEPPALSPLPTEPKEELRKAAVRFLRERNLPITPHKKWPDLVGMPEYGVRGKIPAELQAQPGRVLSVWRDGGWGELVRKGKASDGKFSDRLVTACVALVERWSPTPPPKWVTCIPSLRHPELVPDFAQRLAAALGLPFHQVLAKTEARPAQKDMENPTQQARNVDGSLGVAVRTLPAGPVLLLDDMVDSGWTLAVAAWLLRSKGSGEVWPLALARTGQGT